MSLREARPALAAAGLQDDDGNISLGCLLQRGQERVRVANGLEKQADHAGGLVVERELHVVRNGRDHLVSGRHDVVERDPALVL